MDIRFATDKETAAWNQRVLANPDGGNVLQSKEIAEIKSRSGWRPRYVIAGNVALLALERSVIGIGKFWYVIKGPGVSTTEQLAVLAPSLKKFADTQGIFMVKIEPEIERTDETIIDSMKLGLRKVRNIQPNASTVFLDLSGSLDEIMANLNQKSRHAIRRAERDGAVITRVAATDDNCEKMYELYKITAAGQFAARPYNYYKNFWQSFEKAGMGQLFFAHFDGQLVAAAYAIKFGNKSVYKDGASLRERPVYGVSHLLQWHVIKWAKENGATVHDFCGSPPSDQIKNPDHPFYGFGRFKTSFNKKVTDFVGAYDIVVRPYRYRLWVQFGERIALRWHLWRHHESFY